VACLKVEYREVILLREFEGLSYAEIASVTGDSASSVRSRLFKARRALAEKLGGVWNEERDDR
jgi:RNA polymerase sigma-70 factor (ECF subfamily)